MEAKKSSMIEWVGPRCSIPGIRRSMSGMMEATNSEGMFMSTLKILDEVFPMIYPKAK